VPSKPDTPQQPPIGTDETQRYEPENRVPHQSAAPSAQGGVLTEDFAAQRFAERFAGRFRYCHSTGAWFQWDGNVWRRIRTGVPFHEARLLARELARGQEDKVRQAAMKTNFASGVERFARVDPMFAVTAEAWDADPLLLGTPAGTVDLRTGILRRSDQADGITKQTAVSPSDTADCPLWLKFLADATGGDADLIRFLQQWAGYCLTGLTVEHALLFIYGPGGNGKSVFLNVLTAILMDYAATAAMETFTASRGDKHPTDLAHLRGARLVTASETEEGRPWAESRIKQLTGGDPITARFMRRDFFTFAPTFKLTMVGNHQPVLRNLDEAARRRFNIVPFTRKPDQPDPRLEAKLREERPGILRWMIEGCLDWLRNGLVRPASVTDATQTYFEAQDLFHQWLDDQCEVDPDNTYKWERSVDLYASWSAYAKAAGEPPGSLKTFGPAMIRNGLQPYRTNRVRGYSGIRLRSSLQDGDG
jgi:putative DNA primase/helicase